MLQKEEKSAIQEFYSERTVFITGVTGFLGKAILEKLLRSCPDVSKVFLLIRSKNGKSVESRLERILQSPIFDVLKTQNLNVLKKIVAIEGDITLPNIGMRDEDRDNLIRTVSVVIHSAASVKFNEPLKIALNTNYHGTRRIFNLCHEMEHLVALVHVSTAYSNCDLPEIKEQILAPKSQIWTIKEIDLMTDEEVGDLTSLILGKKPNTYSYAKCMAENLLKDQGSQLPICIVRPSIIGASWKEPQPGYVDNMNGLTGMIAASGKGILTSLVCSGNKLSDVVPLDVSVNLILASAWGTAIDRSQTIPVYNCCTGPKNPITNDEIHRLTFDTFETLPFEGVIRYPSVVLVNSNVLNLFLVYCYNLLPFCLLDCTAIVLGRNPTMLKMLNNVLVAASSITFFQTNEWKFEAENMNRLASRMSVLDKKQFFWNVIDLNWSDYVYNYVLGIKKWIFKEDVKNVPKAVAHRTRIYMLQICVRLLFLLILAFLIVRII